MTNMDINVIHGDCVREMADMPDASVDLVIADPPYGIGFQSNMRTATERWNRVVGDDAPHVAWIEHAARIVKPTGGILTFYRWDVQDAFVDALAAAGVPAKSQLVWHKGGGGMGDLSRTFAPEHELALWSPCPGFAFASGRPPSVITPARVPACAIVHPNEKPVALYERLFRMLTVPGAVIVDPFLGSGASAFAARIIGNRTFTGIEVVADYVDAARHIIRGPVAPSALGGPLFDAARGADDTPEKKSSQWVDTSHVTHYTRRVGNEPGHHGADQ